MEGPNFDFESIASIVSVFVFCCCLLMLNAFIVCCSLALEFGSFSK